MESIYLLIPIAIVLVAIAVAIFLWAVKSDQFEDLDRQGYSILFDEKAKASNNRVLNDKEPTSDGQANDKDNADTSIRMAEVSTKQDNSSQ